MALFCRKFNRHANFQSCRNTLTTGPVSAEQQVRRRGSSGNSGTKSRWTGTAPSQDNEPFHASSHQRFSSRIFSSSSGEKSFSILNKERICSGVFPLIIEATAAQVRSSMSLMFKKFAAMMQSINSSCCFSSPSLMRSVYRNFLSHSQMTSSTLPCRTPTESEKKNWPKHNLQRLFDWLCLVVVVVLHVLDDIFHCPSTYVGQWNHCLFLLVLILKHVLDQACD